MGLFTFRRGEPQELRYRLVPVKRKKGFFFDEEEGEAERDAEISQGWEYVERYKGFYIYRAASTEVRPLHTDPEVLPLALKGLTKRQISTLISTLVELALYVLVSHRIFSIFRSGALLGIGFVLSVLGYGLWLAGGSVLRILRLWRYRKNLLQGADQGYKDWKKWSLAVRLTRLIPWVLALVFVVSLALGLNRSTQRVPLDAVEPPFAVLEDLYPNIRRGEGLGRRLYDEVIRLAEAAGCDRITLHAWDFNQKAFRFYEKLGMTPLVTTMEQRLPIRSAD
jgi:hypothetical protein